MNKYHVFINELDFYNHKIHDLLNIHFINNTDFIFHYNQNIEDIKTFFNLNIDNDKIYMLFYLIGSKHYSLGIDFSNFLNNLKVNNIKLKVVFFTFDFWIREDPIVKKIIPNIFFNPINHYIFTFSPNIEILESFHNRSYTKFKHKFIFENLWYAYNSSFIQFNHNPINKVALSGNLNPNSYPERHYFKLLQNPNKIIINFDNYDLLTDKNTFNHKLNKYLACFTSSVHVYNMKHKKILNTHTILLKVFEILAAGSLLLCPKSEETFLNDIGLESYKNCIICPLKEINKTINFIVDTKNKILIDEIRKNGQEHAMDNLNSIKKYHKIIKHLESL